MIERNNVVERSIGKHLLSSEERTVKSRLGYSIELFNEAGEFNTVVKVPDDTGEVFYLYFSEIESIDHELKEHLKSFFAYLIPRYLPATLRQFNDVVSLFASGLKSGLIPDKALEKTITEDSERNVNVMKSLVRFLILSEYEGISFEKAEEILRLEGYSSNKNNYLTLYTLDEEMGPFTREELRVLHEALQNENIRVADRLLLALCIQFGLRPIQLSLLKESDYVEDTGLGICYLNIPRVKQNTQFRRTAFTKRVIETELACLIKQVIANNQEEYTDYELKSPPLIRKEFAMGEKRYYSLLHSELYTASTVKTDFNHHLRPNTLNKRLNRLVDYLPLSPRTGKPFHLNPYRFRYTVGTNAVMEGMSEEEVADLLDHSSTLCVKHYFRYTREMWELLENATAKRTEQQHFTAAWNREEDLSGNIYGIEIIELHAYTVIGKCQKKAACYLEPAVACYACNKFCPNRDKSSHSNALISLMERKRVVDEDAPTSLSKQLDEAIAGCEAAIAYADDVNVVNIHQKSSGNE